MWAKQKVVMVPPLSSKDSQPIGILLLLIKQLIPNSWCLYVLTFCETILISKTRLNFFVSTFCIALWPKYFPEKYFYNLFQNSFETHSLCWTFKTRRSLTLKSVEVSWLVWTTHWETRALLAVLNRACFSFNAVTCRPFSFGPRVKSAQGGIKSFSTPLTAHFGAFQLLPFA